MEEQELCSGSKEEGEVVCVMAKDEVACVLFEEETLFHTQGVG